MTTCSQRSNWFCFLCANYIYIKNRNKLTELIKNRFIRTYGKLPDNLNEIYVPKILCLTCNNDLQRHLNQNKKLRYNKPAGWKQPKSDHSDCFMCHFSVNKYNRIAKRLFSYPKNTNLIEPILNPDFNNKITNLNNLKSFQNINNNIVNDVLNDLINCVADNKEYEFNKKLTKLNKRSNDGQQQQKKKRKIQYNNLLNELIDLKRNLNEDQYLNENLSEKQDDDISIICEIKNENVDSKDNEFMYHDYNKQQSEEEDESSNEIFDLSNGVCQGSYRIASPSIELVTYFGKKFKKNRKILKTSRCEFDDLTSILDLKEDQQQILEKFFERKNYFIYF